MTLEWPAAHFWQCPVNNWPFLLCISVSKIVVFLFCFFKLLIRNLLGQRRNTFCMLLQQQDCCIMSSTLILFFYFFLWMLLVSRTIFLRYSKWKLLSVLLRFIKFFILHRGSSDNSFEELKVLQWLKIFNKSLYDILKYATFSICVCAS